MITARAAASFDPLGRSVAAARAFVRDTLQGWGFADIVDDAVVLTSELVTNAVVHAGTRAEVLCLRTEDGVRVEVADRYPERALPLEYPGERPYADPDRESGRGLMLCAALATRWGVEYTATHKHVWFRLDLPDRPVGTRSAGPVVPDQLLPLADSRVRVAVVQIDAADQVTAWNEDAEHIFGHAAEKAIGRPLAELAAWPQTPGTGTGIAEALRLSRWEGSYGIRGADGRVIPVYASHLRVRDAHGEPSIVCLLVHDDERALLQTPSDPRRRRHAHGTARRRPLRDLHRLPRPRRPRRPAPAHRGTRPRPPRRRLRLPPAGHRRRDRTGGTGHHRPALHPPALRPRPRRSRHQPVRLRPDARGPRRPGRRPRRRPAPRIHRHALRDHRPPQGRGPAHRLLGIAAEGPDRYTNEDALRLQFAADRIALAVESARLGELERLRRGSLSFLVEASDLLAGTLDRDQTLALMAQMTVPTLATWCAVYTIADQSSDPFLSFVLHEDEERIDDLKILLSRVSPPEALREAGARPWPEASVAVGGETVVLPLMARNRVIGLLTLGKPSEEHFRQEILELAEDLSRRAALALDNARLYSERTAISRSLQRSLLPPGSPAIPGMEVEVIYRAAGEGNEVGGDFYDVFPIRAGVYGFAIGDVCGTGPEAAAVTGLARHALRLLAREGLGGPAVLQRLNAAILDEGARSRFLTLLYGELHPQPDGGALMKVVCAGHPLPLRLRPNGEVVPAAEPQPLLGVIEDLDLYEQTLTLDPGDVLLCVTDGVTERREGTRMLGDDGLTEVLTTCTGLTAGAVAARVLRAVERFAAEPASDDMAILAFRVPHQRESD